MLAQFTIETEILFVYKAVVINTIAEHTRHKYCPLVWRKTDLQLKESWTCRNSWNETKRRIIHSAMNKINRRIQPFPLHPGVQTCQCQPTELSIQHNAVLSDLTILLTRQGHQRLNDWITTGLCRNITKTLSSHPRQSQIHRSTSVEKSKKRSGQNINEKTKYFSLVGLDFYSSQRRRRLSLLSPLWWLVKSDDCLFTCMEYLHCNCLHWSLQTNISLKSVQGQSYWSRVFNYH
jgi:hypothetical protein